MSRQISYHFKFENSEQLQFDVELDSNNKFVPKESSSNKEWTKLNFHKCKNCPLDESEHKDCPVAKNLDYIVEVTKDKLSYEKALIQVKTPERIYSKKADTQEGLLSLFGLIMPSSGCPHLSWFKPLVRFHLPFSTLEETMFRVLSMQLVSSFLNSDEKEHGKEISEMYKEIEKVNLDFISRIHTFCKGDADVNAIAALDLFAKLFEFELDSDFAGLRKMFNS